MSDDSGPRWRVSSYRTRQLPQLLPDDGEGVRGERDSGPGAGGDDRVEADAGRWDVGHHGADGGADSVAVGEGGGNDER